MKNIFLFTVHVETKNHLKHRWLLKTFCLITTIILPSFKKIVRHRFRQSGFRRISTPVFENSDAFHRSLGDETEIIKRELYTFEDPRGRETYSLRPELTTGIVRSFIEHEMHQGPLPVELYAIERCFRFERPSSRTKREFWQVGGEILGETDPAIDAQVIYLAHRILSDCGIRDHIELKIKYDRERRRP